MHLRHLHTVPDLPRRPRNTRSIWMVCLCLGVSALSCDESLPPRIEPANVVAYGVSSSGASVVVTGGEVPTNATYSLTAMNRYDDVISDDARLNGSLTIRLKDKPEIGGSLSFSVNDLLTGRMLSGKTLTIEPGQILTLIRPWNHHTDAGVPLWQYLRLTRLITEKGKVYFRSDTTKLLVSGSLQIFEKVQAGRILQTEFPVVYTLYDTIADTTTLVRQ
jgi:hypothetical protein